MEQFYHAAREERCRRAAASLLCARYRRAMGLPKDLAQMLARYVLLVQTDLVIAIPEGRYGRIAHRSSLALKHHLDVGAGVIDSDYRGSVGVVLFNHSQDEYKIIHKWSSFISSRTMSGITFRPEPPKQVRLPRSDSNVMRVARMLSRKL